jgi:cytosine permease
VTRHRIAVPWYLRLGAWVGIGTGPGALMAGGGIAQVTDSPWRLPSVLLGVLALTSLAVLSANLGRRRGKAAVGLAEQAFGGRWGERLVAACVVAGVSGWAGLYIGLSAGALHLRWDVNPLATALLLGVGFWMLYRTGFRRWNLMVVLTGAAALAVAVLVSSSVVADPAPREAATFPGPEGALFGAGIVVAYAAVFALRAPDFTWDAQRGADVVRAGLVMAATLLMFLAIGVGIYAEAGSWDLSDLVNRTTAPTLGALLLLLSAIAPTVSGLHSGALGIRRLAGWPQPLGAAAIALAGAVLGAFRFDLLLIPFLGVLGAVMPPVLGVVLLRTARNRDWHAWAAWLAGSAAALALLARGYPAHVLAGIAVSGALLLLLALAVPATSRRQPCPVDSST